MQVKVPLDNQLKSLKKSVALLKNVNKFYGEGPVKVKALDDLNLEVFHGDYLAVMGESGSGKSTAMNILGCLDRPTHGTYELNGTAVEKLDDDSLADIRNKELGFVFQQFHLLQEVSALENVMLPMIYACVPSVEREKRAKEASDVVKAYPSIEWSIPGMSSLKVALIFCVLVTAIGGIISNPLFNFADSAVNGTPLLREAITLASKSSFG